MTDFLMIIFFLVPNSSPIYQENGLTPLDNALWKGTVDIKITGHLNNQCIGNTLGNYGTPTGFSREKSRLDADFTLTFEFLINPLGEYTLLANERFEAKINRNLEIKTLKEEEITLEGGINTKTNIQIMETKKTELSFFNEEQYNQDTFKVGDFSIRPSGRLDKKGQISIYGDLVFTYIGKGSYVSEKERQPPSEEFARLQETAKLTQSLQFPIKFLCSLPTRKKPINGVIQFDKAMKNPFSHEGEKNKRDTFTSNLKYTGTIQLQPLFSKK